MNGFGDEIAKLVGRTLVIAIAAVVVLLVAAFLIGRWSA